jgi:hypothetical protein
MVCRWRLIALIAVVASVTLACGSSAGVVREVTDDDLRAMTLRERDLPPGFSLTDEKLTNNQEFAAAFTDPLRARLLVDEWGRVSGITSSFRASDILDKTRQPLTISSLIERYADQDGGRLRWESGDRLAKYLKSPQMAVTLVQGPRVGDQSMSSRMYVSSTDGVELVVYSVTFRRGALVAEVVTTAYKHRDDKGDRAFRLARLLDERISAQLSS